MNDRVTGGEVEEGKNTNSQIWSSSMPLAIFDRTMSTTCWLERTSQIPSQARTMNSSSGVYFLSVISGSAGRQEMGEVSMEWREEKEGDGRESIHVTACCSGGRLGLRLKSKSPKALERARFPFTRPYCTKPPAAVMRAFSPSLVGLWSKDRGTATPADERTLRESPAFAQ